jgi:N-acetylmuramoyl-L-alanine amidase/uncharacterized protein YgiM (DUF1202 family)
LKSLRTALVTALLVSIPSVSWASTLRPSDKDGLNIRSGPGLTFKLVGVMAANDAATVVEQQADWVHVRTAAGLDGWVSGLYSSISYSDGEATAVVNTDIINVRQGPLYGTTILTTLKQDQRVQLLQQTAFWWRIRTITGLEGWVAAPYMAMATTVVTKPPVIPPPSTVPPKPVPPPVVTPPVVTPPVVTPPAPPAPASAVPVLPIYPVVSPLAVGAKTVRVLRTTTMYEGRDPNFWGNVDVAKPGETLTFLDAAEGWIKVSTPRGNRGWMLSSDAVITEGNLVYSVAKGRWTQNYFTASVPVPVTPAPTGSERRVVRDADGSNLRSGPSTTAAIITTLMQGESMDVLERQAPWLRVKTSSGLIGWVNGDFTVLLSPVPVSPPAPTAVPIPSVNGVSVTVTETTPGAYRLDVDNHGLPLGTPVVQGNTLSISLPTPSTADSNLPIANPGLKFLTVGPNGIRLQLDRVPGWQVVSQGDGKLSIILQPVITAISNVDLADRSVIGFKVNGTVSPNATVVGDNVVLDLPGATLASGVSSPGVVVQATSTGVRLAVGTKRAYAIKLTADGVELHLYKPGLAGKTILLDPGHGGYDSGATNPALSLTEKEANLNVALRLRAILVAKGANVIMTRATDITPAPPEAFKDWTKDKTHNDLAYRVRMANELGVDLFLSIHHNAGDTSGTETFSSPVTLNGSRGGQLAQLLQTNLVNALGLRNRGAKLEAYYVTQNTMAPAALAEIGFIDNLAEGRLIKSPEFQQKGAQALAEGIERFYDGRP